MAGPKPEYSSLALQYGDDTNYAAQGDAYDATALKTAPALSIIKQGLLRPGKQVGAQWFNWVANQWKGVMNALIAHVLDIEANTISAPALNWGASANIGASSVSIAWSDIEQAWYAVQSASSATQYRSADFGKTWSTITVASAAALLDIFFDPSGNGVVVSNAGTVQDAAYVSYGSLTWTNRPAVTTSFHTANVVYEPTSAKWCILGGVNATGAKVYTSSDRATWTNRVIPSAWSTYAGSPKMQLGVGNGIIVAAFPNSTTTFRTMLSADGGVTWTNDQSVSVNAGITVGATSLSARPQWSAQDGLWYIAVFAPTGARKVQLFSSPDAITWTSVMTSLSSDMTLVTLSVIGSLLVGHSDDGRVYESSDKGVTWYRCGIGSLTNPNLMRAGGNGLLVLGTTTASASSRFGRPTRLA